MPLTTVATLVVAVGIICSVDSSTDYTTSCSDTVMEPENDSEYLFLYSKEVNCFHNSHPLLYRKVVPSLFLNTFHCVNFENVISMILNSHHFPHMYTYIHVHTCIH